MGWCPESFLERQMLNEFRDHQLHLCVKVLNSTPTPFDFSKKKKANYICTLLFVHLSKYMKTIQLILIKWRARNTWIHTFVYIGNKHFKLIFVHILSHTLLPWFLSVLHAKMSQEYTHAHQHSYQYLSHIHIPTEVYVYIFGLCRYIYMINTYRRVRERKWGKQKNSTNKKKVKYKMLGEKK